MAHMLKEPCLKHEKWGRYMYICKIYRWFVYVVDVIACDWNVWLQESYSIHEKYERYIPFVKYIDGSCM